MPIPSESLHLIVVDDDPAARFVLRSQLKRDGHVVETAECAAECMTLLQDIGPDHIDAVISDYWMPGGNGLELLKQIRALDPTLSVLVATAEGEKSIVAEVLRQGGVGYLDKPVGGEALREAVSRAARKTREQRDLRATAADASALGDSQRLLLQHHLSRLEDCVELFFSSKADASGDFVSVLPVNDHRHIILVSDASGHDLRAAFQSNYFHGIARGMAARGARIDEVFTLFNDMLLDEWNRNDDVHLSLAAGSVVLDRGALSLHSLNCGLPPPVVCDSDGFAYPLQASQCSGPLGWFPDLPSSAYNPMPTGYVIVWSDGLPDLAEIHDVDPLALAHRLLQSDPAKASYLVDAPDDLAAVRINLARYAELDVTPAIPLISRRLAGNSIDEIDGHQAWIERSLRLALPTLADAPLADVTICAREALINALTHGCEGRADRLADIQVSYTPEKSQLHLRITDSGTGHDFDLDQHEPAAAADLLTEHRGLVMMKHLPHRTAAFSRGACLAMDFEI
ncbi:response regulator [Actomonas aquatica]|uniref:Response regulator n=1 Tax=Actomonas aquatica TaxID=2866162 RepID=A0ABZ1CDQ7_9BACT|nr:response regulator [Opitutus sp. WL0086]WRQ89422.1 response regulator [Opitutus sp. WL0086]